MTKHKGSKKAYERYLDEIDPPFESDQWIIAGKRRYLHGRYGHQLRIWDPIAFEVGYDEWQREKH